MRELMVVFSGNEMSLGWMLAAWLLWTALGSGAVGRLGSRTINPRRAIAYLQVLVAAAFPFAIWLIRASKKLFETIPGELLGPGPMILTSLVVLSVFCLASGGLFALASRLAAMDAGNSAAAGTSRVYLLEALGSGIGGILASLVLIRYLPPFQIAAFVALLNLLAAATLTIRHAAWQRATLGSLAAVFALLVLPFAAPRLEKASLSNLWHGFDLLTTRNSVYGNLAVVQTGGIRTLYENGWVSFHAPDEQSAEESVHFALLEHPSPHSVLLIGGGLNGSIAQALQHPTLQSLDYVELDPKVLDLAQQFFPAQFASLFADPRVHLHNTDGRLFLKTTEANFDVIIVNLPDPQTAQLNRFYTAEFFREAANKLTPNGVFSLQLRGAEDYIGPELAEFLRCIHHTLQQVFPEIVAVPGDPVHFLASPQPGSLTTDPAELIARVRARHLQTKYVREYYLPYRLTPDRLLDLQTQLQPDAYTRSNHDFTPVAYYFDVALWSTQFNRDYRHIFQTVAQWRFRSLLLVLVFTLCVIIALVRWGPRARARWRMASAFSVGAMGFTLIGLEMLLLLAFQAIYGYVYQQLAIIIAAFMVGMAFGSAWALRSRSEHKAGVSAVDARRLLRVQFIAALLPLVVWELLRLFAATKDPPLMFMESQMLLPLLAVLCGAVGGYQFPVASWIFFAESHTGQTSPGALYALDLVGACLGALLLTGYLLPVFGFQKTALLMAVVNLAPAVPIGLFAFAKRLGPE